VAVQEPQLELEVDEPPDSARFLLLPPIPNADINRSTFSPEHSGHLTDAENPDTSISKLWPHVLQVYS